MKAQKNDFSRNVTKKTLTVEFAVDRTRARLNDLLLHVTKNSGSLFPQKKKKMDLGGEIKELD